MIWLKGYDLSKVVSGLTLVIILATSSGSTFARLQANVDKSVGYDKENGGNSIKRYK